MAKSRDKMRAKSAKKAVTLFCTFCGKSQHEVKKLISGPASIFICNECVEICNRIVDDQPYEVKPFNKELPIKQLLEGLRPIEDTLQAKGNQLQHRVEQLRARKVSWAQIGAALGISRQSAWERFR